MRYGDKDRRALSRRYQLTALGKAGDVGSVRSVFSCFSERFVYRLKLCRITVGNGGDFDLGALARKYVREVL